MVSFDVEMVGDSPNDMQERLEKMGTDVAEAANDALVEKGKEVKKDLEDTSPVDTGDYEEGWYGPVEVAENEVWILNEADHAKYVMLPNSRMRGSASADVPSMGILHNVKGVARKHSDDLNMAIGAEIRDFIRAFGKR